MIYMAFGWIGTCVLIMAIAQVDCYFVLKDILKELKELKNRIKE